jgi:flagellar motor switch protein FliG
MTVALRERPFAALQQVEPRRVHACLAGEHPQTIALVLWHLARPLAMSVLRSFPDALQQSIVRRIAEMGVTDLAVVHDVEQALAARMMVPTPHLRRF